MQCEHDDSLRMYTTMCNAFTLDVTVICQLLESLLFYCTPLVESIHIG